MSSSYFNICLKEFGDTAADSNSVIPNYGMRVMTSHLGPRSG
jgi:hypothetical protein